MTYILGLLIGSFLNVCIYRIPRGESIVTSPSHCTACGKDIPWYHLVPVLSYIILRGRCRFCKTKINIRYPIIECVNMIAYGVICHYMGFTVDMIVGCILFSTLLVIALIDIEHYIIPNGMNLFLLIVGVTYSIITDRLLEGATGFLTGLIMLLVIFLLSRGKMGGGDIKLLAVSGWFIGWKSVMVTLFGASLMGSIVTLFLIAWGKRSREDKIPFGPYLAFGILITFFYGEQLIRWYLNLLGV